jgi:hypothetical protein
MNMKDWKMVAAIVVLGVASTAHAGNAATSVFEGNQAVTADKITKARKVEYPTWVAKDANDKYSNPSARQPSWDEATNKGTPSIWYMIEGPNGLLECGGLSISPKVCRAPTLGTYKWIRHWVVKKDGEWVLCAGGKKPYRCAPRNQVVFLLTNAIPE